MRCNVNRQLAKKLCVVVRGTKHGTVSQVGLFREWHRAFFRADPTDKAQGGKRPALLVRLLVDPGHFSNW